MSTQQPDDSTHPANMDEDARTAALAALDDEDGELAQAGTGQVDEPTAAANAGSEDEPVTQPKDADATPAPGDQAEPPAADEDDKPIDRKAFNGVLNELRQTREKVKELEAKQGATIALPESRDFKAERNALKEKWDNGDLDTDEYNDARDALVLEEADHRAAVKFHAMQQQSQVQAATQSWNDKVNVWQEANAEFLANPIRRKAVNDLMAEFDADPNNKLDDDALLAKVQETAFEAFNWTGAAAAAPAVTASPRQVASAQAAAAASAAPPALAGGVGSGARAAATDLEAAVANPSKAAAAKQAVADVLGEEA